MTNGRIKNYEAIARTEERQKALEIAEAGLEAIDTEKIIFSSFKLEGDLLKIKDKEFDLKKYKTVKLIGMGKASSIAASAISKILDGRVWKGAVIDKRDGKIENRVPNSQITEYWGTHPKPSYENYQYSNDLIGLVQPASEDDLIIVVVSGGGSALFCWPEQECIDSQKLYERFLKTGETIKELNTVRKHISLIKGGGLAKLLYPATVIGLIFSDIPGDHNDEVASGPTYFDTSTVQDAKEIVDKYDLGEFNLTETPKEQRYFEKVTNIVLVSNQTAIEAMTKKAEELGFSTKTISAEIYDSAEKTIREFEESSQPGIAIFGGGEIRMKITSDQGSGGRNSYLAAKIISDIKDDQVFISLASDGTDNGTSAGAIVDKETKNNAEKLNDDLDNHIQRFDTANLFKELGDEIETGPTGANVSDLIILINK